MFVGFGSQTFTQPCSAQPELFLRQGQMSGFRHCWKMWGKPNSPFIALILLGPKKQKLSYFKMDNLRKFSFHPGAWQKVYAFWTFQSMPVGFIWLWAL